ncbi:hypothetical protein F2Q70_00002897 [Brassica cretica]|uniref:Uncharacterized protein n=1 Tax=Brassica cretica TaxID=69181 RepID=A0A8S9IZ67_BRACR|nr:hypothetical protein F2Q70_00002897 [Brassica cretica]
MPVLQKSSQSASQEEAVEEMKDCRSITHHWCRSKPSTSDESQSSESIDTKPSASVDTLRISEKPETEKSKSGGRTMNRKKKKKRNADADSLSVVPLQCQEASLAYRVRCRGDSESFTKVRVLCDPELRDKGLSPSFDTRYSFELTFQCHQFKVNQHPVAEVMPVLQKSSQSASQEEAVEEMKDCRSITHHWCRSKVMPERGPSIFQDRFTPSYQNTHGRPDILLMYF